MWGSYLSAKLGELELGREVGLACRVHAYHRRCHETAEHELLTVVAASLWNGRTQRHACTPHAVYTAALLHSRVTYQTQVCEAQPLGRCSSVQPASTHTEGGLFRLRLPTKRCGDGVCGRHEHCGIDVPHTEEVLVDAVHKLVGGTARNPSCEQPSSATSTRGGNHGTRRHTTCPTGEQSTDGQHQPHAWSRQPWCAAQMP